MYMRRDNKPREIYGLHHFVESNLHVEYEI